MKREYIKWFSSNLQREMELLIFGHAGSPVLFFPTRMGRFYDYENWGVIKALEEKIVSGKNQLYCLDSIDAESFYCKSIPPTDRIYRYTLYEKYLLEEVIPFIKQHNKNELISAGCSLGAYHAVNIAFRHPHLFKKTIGISGRYDLTIQVKHFDNLFEGYLDDTIYSNMPALYIPNLSSKEKIPLQNLDIILVVGKEDLFVKNNLQLSESLRKKNIPHQLHLVEGEAHKAIYWGALLNNYL
jgi:esterase/lipase superfamily enzyme